MELTGALSRRPLQNLENVPDLQAGGSVSGCGLPVYSTPLHTWSSANCGLQTRRLRPSKDGWPSTVPASAPGTAVEDQFREGIT